MIIGVKHKPRSYQILCKKFMGDTLRFVSLEVKATFLKNVHALAEILFLLLVKLKIELPSKRDSFGCLTFAIEECDSDLD